MDETLDSVIESYEDAIKEIAEKNEEIERLKDLVFKGIETIADQAKQLAVYKQAIKEAVELSKQLYDVCEEILGEDIDLKNQISKLQKLIEEV